MSDDGDREFGIYITGCCDVERELELRAAGSGVEGVEESPW